LEKRILESWLKRAGIGLANLKSRSDFELCGAMNIQFDIAALCQFRADRFQSERGRVAITAEMSQHNALDSSGQ
jgi:hypothetical protein